VISEPDLVIPNPDVLTREFVAGPILELAPEITLPDNGRKLADVVNSIPPGSMEALAEFTQSLRREIIDES